MICGAFRKLQGEHEGGTYPRRAPSAQPASPYSRWGLPQRRTHGCAGGRARANGGGAWRTWRDTQTEWWLSNIERDRRGSSVTGALCVRALRQQTRPVLDGEETPETRTLQRAFADAFTQTCNTPGCEAGDSPRLFLSIFALSFTLHAALWSLSLLLQVFLRSCKSRSLS